MQFELSPAIHLGSVLLLSLERELNVSKVCSTYPDDCRKSNLHVGSLNDIPSILLALQGVYGAWINVDGFTVGEEKETYLGIRIFELAKQVRSVKHFVWSSIDYGYKVCKSLIIRVVFLTTESS